MGFCSVPSRTRTFFTKITVYYFSFWRVCDGPFILRSVKRFSENTIPFKNQSCSQSMFADDHKVQPVLWKMRDSK